MEKERLLDVGQLQLLWELFLHKAQLGVLAALPQQVFSPCPLAQVEPQRGQQERLDLCAPQADSVYDNEPVQSVQDLCSVAQTPASFRTLSLDHI